MRRDDTRPLPRYVQRKRSHGFDYYYFRWQDVYRRLPDNPNSEAFRIEYSRALASIAPERETLVIAGSVRALIRDYKDAPEWTALAPKTQSDYARVLDYLRPIGDFKADNVRRQHLIRIRNKIGTNTRTQDLFVQAASRMFSIGMDLGYTDRNPAARIARLNDPQSYEPWPIEAHQKFIVSEMPQWMRTAYMLGLWTAQREGDILRLARARFDGAGFTIRQGRPEAKRGKGRKGKIVTLYIQAAYPLREYLDRCTFPGLLFVTDEVGKPIPATLFRHTLRAHLDAIGLTDLHFHGLRHTTATALAELGGSDSEIQALLGHQTRQMAERYTKKASQKRLAAAAVTRLEKGWNR
jgi:integrase